MKKSTIKRRKRVVPAYPDVALETDSPATHQRLSAPPDSPSLPPAHLQGQDLNIESQDRQLPPRRQPPTIDFTGYNPSDLDLPPIRDQSQTSRKDKTKKRSLSTANSESTGMQGLDLNGRANVMASQAMDDMQLDPALVGIGRRRSTELEPTDRESYKAERRAQLVREAEGMREILRQKERELADLQ